MQKYVVRAFLATVNRKPFHPGSKRELLLPSDHHGSEGARSSQTCRFTSLRELAAPSFATEVSFDSAEGLFRRRCLIQHVDGPSIAPPHHHWKDFVGVSQRGYGVGMT